MTLYAWLTFILITMVQTGSPGPSTVFLINNAIRFGPLKAIGVLTGDVFAILLMGLISSLGIATFFAHHPALFNALKLAGAAYLIYLGVAAFNKSRRAAQVAGPVVAQAGAPSVGRQWSQSFLVGISNPKAFVYFAALLPQFEKSGTPDLQFFALLVVISALIKFCLLSGYALLATRIASRLTSPSAGKTGSRIVAVFFVFFGAALGLSTLH
ncbi:MULTISPECIES: LysE family translocator [unclassified Pseudomonas]|uniref:LysE family translocator n=1 Tax=unclassified Pseudomonas TaxID=196821 RepID=UPI0015A38628|nr:MULTISPECIES: LysE family translocator [unclassified Pseudomonas]NWC92552.1 LysE family translocator [Pseudomonas sp. IPO3779]NWD15302.1 LysE family translocator [Pseudomonas sp. IPO3778]